MKVVLPKNVVYENMVAYNEHRKIEQKPGECQFKVELVYYKTAKSNSKLQVIANSGVTADKLAQRCHTEGYRYMYATPTLPSPDQDREGRYMTVLHLVTVSGKSGVT